MDIIDLTSCPTSGLFYGGRAGQKTGILIGGEPWIAKYPRPGRELTGRHVPSYTSSPVAEWLGSHIYQSLGIEAHETMLGFYGGKVVCACRDFTWPDKRLFEFAQIKASVSDEEVGFAASPSDGSVILLSDVISTLEVAPVIRDMPEARERFWEMFVVDALIKNPDRNNGNWGLVMHPDRSYSLAPVYDNGSSLFAKRSRSVTERRLGVDRAVEEDSFSNTLSCYMIQDPDTGRSTHIKPFDYIRTSTNPQLVRAIDGIVDRFDRAAVDNLIDAVPTEAYGRILMSDSQRASHHKLIGKRFLEGIYPYRSKRLHPVGATTVGAMVTGKDRSTDGDPIGLDISPGGVATQAVLAVRAGADPRPREPPAPRRHP